MTSLRPAEFCGMLDFGVDLAADEDEKPGEIHPAPR
jgi:hypothetical protein